MAGIEPLPVANTWFALLMTNNTLLSKINLLAQKVKRLDI